MASIAAADELSLCENVVCNTGNVNIKVEKNQIRGWLLCMLLLARAFQDRALFDDQNIQRMHGSNVCVLNPNKAGRTIKPTECSKCAIQRTFDFYTR